MSAPQDYEGGNIGRGIAWGLVLSALFWGGCIALWLWAKA